MREAKSKERRSSRKGVFLNLVVIPGFGTVTEGDWKTGLGQLILAGTGVFLMMAGFWSFSLWTSEVGGISEGIRGVGGVTSNPELLERLAVTYSANPPTLAGINPVFLMFLGVGVFMISWGWCLVCAFSKKQRGVEHG
jgi:hypothetical protein